MTAAQLRPGSSGVIHEVGGPRAFRRRLMELGFVPGTPIHLVGVAPLGDPWEFEVRGGRLSIRRNEAEAVELA